MAATKSPNDAPEPELVDPISDDRQEYKRLLELIANGETPAGVRSEAVAKLFELLGVYTGLVG